MKMSVLKDYVIVVELFNKVSSIRQRLPYDAVYSCHLLSAVCLPTLPSENMFF